MFLEQNLGLRLTEQIVLDDGTEAGVWLASNQKSYDVTYTRDQTRTRRPPPPCGVLRRPAGGRAPRGGHLPRARDRDGVRAAQARDPADVLPLHVGARGNRIEIASGGYLIYAPDHEAVVWSQAERAKGQAWGMQTVASFHIKGSPPVPEEESLLAAAGH